MTQKRRMNATKRADALFSARVRSRGRCEMASLFPAINCNGNLQCAHIVSRRYKALRWNAENTFCACAAHHLYQTHHPLEFEAAMEEHEPGNLADLKWQALHDPPMNPQSVIDYLEGEG